MRVFFDSSALAKRYHREPGSAKVEEALRQTSTLVVSILCIPEIVSALCRLKREGHLLPLEYHHVKQAVLRDLADATVCTLTPAVITRAIDVLERNPVRASDALHVACAAETGAFLFVTADARQASAARGARLRVESV